MTPAGTPPHDLDDPEELAAADPSGATGPDAPDQVFLGTSVVSGTATAVAIATGPRTMFGDIAVRLGRRVPETDSFIAHASFAAIFTVPF